MNFGVLAYQAFWPKHRKQKLLPCGYPIKISYIRINFFYKIHAYDYVTSVVISRYFVNSRTVLNNDAIVFSVTSNSRLTCSRTMFSATALSGRVFGAREVTVSDLPASLLNNSPVRQRVEKKLPLITIKTKAKNPEVTNAVGTPAAKSDFLLG